jgi:hypothetical protein
MCHRPTCTRDCIKAAHNATTDEDRAKVRAACCCDPLADELAALVEGGMGQREASELLWGAA